MEKNSNTMELFLCRLLYIRVLMNNFETIYRHNSNTFKHKMKTMFGKVVPSYSYYTLLHIYLFQMTYI
jgi:hypothetical protein